MYDLIQNNQRIKIAYIYFRIKKNILVQLCVQYAAAGGGRNVPYCHISCE